MSLIPAFSSQNHRTVQDVMADLYASGMGVNFLSVNGNHSIVVQIMSRILISIGGGCSVMTSQLATQASVPHQDMAIAIAILGLWTSIGGGVGSAIAGAVWTQRLPQQLAANLGEYYNATELAGIYGDVTLARAAEPRALVIQSQSSSIPPCLPYTARRLTHGQATIRPSDHFSSPRSPRPPSRSFAISS